MEIGLDEDQEALRRELREYFAELVTPEIRDEMAGGELGGPKSLEGARKMGADGWLGYGWPTEFGGQGLSLIHI